MPAKRRLIVNADDFGLSPGVNQGVMEAHERGIVTSASLMVRWPAAPPAAAYARDHPRLSLGLHVDLGEWTYLGGEWLPRYEVVSHADQGAVAAEVARQLDAFRRLTGAEPTHLDSHQHVHLREPVRSVMVELAKQNAIPLRRCADTVRYCGDFYGQSEEGARLPGAICSARLIEIVTGLAAGLTELACHPGYAADLETMYRAERAQEVKVLCDPRVRAAITSAGIELCSFREINKAIRKTGRTRLPAHGESHD